MRLRSLHLFQICKLQCKFDGERSCDTGYLHYDPLLEWIGFEEIYVNIYYLTRNQDDAYVEDKVTVGLLLLAGSHKVCLG